MFHFGAFAEILCCHVTAKMPSNFIVYGAIVPQYKSFQYCHENATMDSLPLLSSYKIFRTAVNNNKY